MFNINLIAAQTELTAAHSMATQSSGNRAFLLRATALRLKELFEAYAEMDSFQLTLYFKVEDLVEGQNDRVVKYRQHLKIVAPNCAAMTTSDDKATFFMQNMPFWQLGNGSFCVTRDHAVLQQLLATPEGSPQELVAAYALALELDQAFQDLRTAHFLGEIL